MTPEQYCRAGRAVATRIREMGTNPTAVAHAAGVDPRTLHSLINGRRWPTDHVQDAIERVLRWRPGEIAARAVRGDRSLEQLSDSELATELTRRLRERDRREMRLRASDMSPVAES